MELSALRILVADDDPDLLHDVASAVEALGATVTRAPSGAELIAHLGQDDPYDLVITDVAMPWMTGLQAMHATRYAGLATPVIVMTALRDRAIPAQVLALGDHALLLRKPFGMVELEHAIASVLQRPVEHRAAR